MKILTCSLYPTSGTARLGGHDILEEPLAVKRLVGYLPENAPLYTDLTVAEYLGFIAEAREMARGTRRAAIERVVESCGLASVYRRGIDELSKGFRQRVGLAQALVHDPPILVLDEPTTGLDPQQIVEMRGLIRGLGERKSVILSSHILAEVDATCQRALILVRGRIVAQGTREEMANRLRGGTLLAVGFRAPAAGLAALEGLANVPGVTSVVETRLGEEGAVHARLAIADGAEDAVFAWAVGKGLTIVSMVPERLSLEEVFLSVTRETAP